MNLTGILLFGGTIFGDGGSSESGLKTVTFDGNLTGKETFSGDVFELGDMTYVKVLDKAITLDEAQDFVIKGNLNGEVIEQSIPMDVVTPIEDEEAGLFIWEVENYPAPVMLAFRDDFPIDDVTTITEGTYVIYAENFLLFDVMYLSSVTYGNSGGGTSGNSANEAEFPVGENYVLRVFSAPLLDFKEEVWIDIEGVAMRKVWDALPNVNGALACTVVYVNDFAGNTASVTMTSANDTFGTSETGLAFGMDNSGFVFLSADVDALGEEAEAFGITENGVYFREGIGVFGYIALLFVCEA